MKLNAREGDLIETNDEIFFDVKGLVHPPDRIIAFPRFIPDLKADRKRGEAGYRKIYSLSDRYALLKKSFPKYLVYDPVFDEHLCEVPLEAVRCHYRPVDRLHKLRHSHRVNELENQAIQLMELLKETSNVSWSQLGISGSLLVKLHTSTSDIDPVVYGSKSCSRVYSALRSLVKNKTSPLRNYRPKELEELFDFRSKDTCSSFEDFVRTESRKVLQGMFMEQDYFVRFVKDWNEVEEEYDTIQYKNFGYTKIKARVAEDSQMIFTPCCYEIDNVKVIEGPLVEPIKEIVSFRGRFCEQARNGETVIARGKIERVQKTNQHEYYRLLLGNHPSDHMVLA